MYIGFDWLNFPAISLETQHILTAKIAKQLFFSIRVYDAKSNTSEFVLCRRSQRESISYRIAVLLQLLAGLHISRPVFLVQQRDSRWSNFSVRWRIFFNLRLGKYTSFISCQSVFPLLKIPSLHFKQRYPLVADKKNEKSTMIPFGCFRFLWMNEQKFIT